MPLHNELRKVSKARTRRWDSRLRAFPHPNAELSSSPRVQAIDEWTIHCSTKGMRRAETCGAEPRRVCGRAGGYGLAHDAR